MELNFAWMRRALFSRGFLILGLLAVLSCLQLQADVASSNWEFWSQMTLEKKFSDTFTSQISKLSKYNSGVCYYQEWDWNALFNSRNTTQYKLGYHNSIENAGTNYQKETDLLGAVIFNWKAKGWEISDENQLEYRFFSYTAPNYPRYINQLTLAYPIKTKRRVIRPYISDQVCYDFRFDEDGHCGVNQNRVYLGVKSDYPDKFQLDVYYLRQTNGQVLDGGQPLPVFNVGGINLTFKF